MRISQWYKNTLVFIPLIFSLNFFNLHLFLITFVGFISLSLMSSSYYIINDIKDYKKDQYHPEKKKRPIASGRISRPAAFLLFLILFIDSLLIAYLLSPLFLLAVVILFISSQLYIFYFRNIAFFDIIIISLNFVIRALAGIPLIISLAISPPYAIVLAAFFLSIFMVSGKRIAETYIKGLEKYRLSLNKHHKETLNLMAIVSVACTVVFYSLYAFLIEKPLILITLPVAFYLIILYFNSVYHDQEKIRNPEKFILDKKIIISVVVWVVLLLITLYFV
ncbi:MAG: UbiA prenyltransferase family protein [archaeon]